ncbi:MAG: thermonuclease family protein [Polyangiaceae bacterium]|nr:thermonuclease family protein [Polyangiaceae bacterium]
MERSTVGFWIVVVAMLGAAGFFGMGAEARRREAQKSEAALETGEIVTLERILDADTITVRKESGETVAVRIIGIKAFNTQPVRDPTARWGQAARDALEKACKDQPIRVLLGTPAQDKHGRTLATLYVDDHDVGFDLVKAGLALVYTVYPFPSMSMYLAEQEAAQGKQKGIWGDEAVAERARLLGQEWRRQAK